MLSTLIALGIALAATPADVPGPLAFHPNQLPAPKVTQPLDDPTAAPHLPALPRIPWEPLPVERQAVLEMPPNFLIDAVLGLDD